ncbi:MAG TPA: lasso peptide biosynthesis B2 protein [Rhodothermales bacterium]|jgi:hypothetical protein|nr:lasso peptide biosynthesis B2 protein [Rhodothermales bacterium]
MATSREGSEGVPQTLPRLTPGAKIALVFEILTAYGRMWRAMGHPDVLRLATKARGVRSLPRVDDPLEHQVARRLGKVVGKVLRTLPTDSRCLIRSLVLVRILSRRSIPNTLVIGVRKESDFQAHAWVEHDGVPILPAGAYTRLMEM